MKNVQSIFVRENTKIEQYQEQGISYFVKREDLAIIPPGPPFAKIRGLSVYLEKIKQKGITTVGHMDTAISMAGWGLSFLAQQIGIDVILYYPEYKEDWNNQKVRTAIWKKYGASVYPIQHPSRHRVNIYRAKKHFHALYPNGVFLPNGLQFPETVIAVEKEACQTIMDTKPKTLICCVGSGVMLAGILRGIFLAGSSVERIDAILIDNKMNAKTKKKNILSLAGIVPFGILPTIPTIKQVTNQLTIFSGKYGYHDKAKQKSPFPCNPYYDLKAFEYLCENITKLPQPILFWNIGA